MRKLGGWRNQVTLVALASAMLTAWLTYSYFHSSTPSRPFDAAEWQKVTQTRAEMIDDLLARYNFVGWPSSKVIELLGPPDKDISGFPQWDSVYVLGLERSGSFSLDDEALGFKFDMDGNVTKYGVSVN